MKDNWPDWLKKAITINAVVEIVDGSVVWKGGIWKYGMLFSKKHP